MRAEEGHGEGCGTWRGLWDRERVVGHGEGFGVRELTAEGYDRGRRVLFLFCVKANLAFLTVLLAVSRNWYLGTII